jgi:putative nucleotidyltransferase with HDIG domain
MGSRLKTWLAVQVVLLTGVVAAAIVFAGQEPFGSPALFVVLCVLGGVSEWLAVMSGSQRVSGTWMSLVLAMVLLGPTAAVALGAVTTFVYWLRWRTQPASVLNDLLCYCGIGLLGALAHRALAGPAVLAGWPVDGVARYAGGVALTFIATLLAGFALVAVNIRLVRGKPSVREQFVKGLLPLLPSEVLTAALTALTATLFYRWGSAGPVLAASCLLIYQYLLGALLRSEERAERLEAAQFGVLVAMLKTLALRDKVTARHSAAVSRYAQKIAAEMGMDDEAQGHIHTAGLLHDIGKFTFPDDILFADSRLDDDQWAIVRRHPEQGERVVSHLAGFGSIAKVIRHHHERVDGTGYPDGLAGDEIPLPSRIISVADVYDVMTSRDSYRKPVKVHEAVAELRRVSGAQLDGDVVDAFLRVLQREGAVFGHQDDADFETELAARTILPGTQTSTTAPALSWASRAAS